MTMRTDATYDLFQQDAQRQGFDTLAAYFRHYGIVPPIEWGQPAHKKRELDLSGTLEEIATQGTWTEAFSIYKSWGEPGKTILTAAGREWDA